MNYIGGKYKLLPQLIELFPKAIDTFVDLFAGSFTVTANVKANNYICNDINYKVVEMVRTLCYADIEVVLARIHAKIKEYGLSKTNAEGYKRFREFYNLNSNPIDLFTLSCFSFNYQFRIYIQCTTAIQYPSAGIFKQFNLNILILLQVKSVSTF